MMLIRCLLCFNVLILIIFVSQCACKRNDRKTTGLETPYHEVAPVLMTAEQYKALESLRVNVTNVPDEATNLVIWNLRSNMTIGKNKTNDLKKCIRSCVYYIPKLKLNDGESVILVTVFTKDGDCGTKPILMIQEKRVSVAKHMWHEVQQDWVETCSDKHCVIELNWGNICAKDASPLRKAKSREIDTELSFIDQVLLFDLETYVLNTLHLDTSYEDEYDGDIETGRMSSSFQKRRTKKGIRNFFAKIFHSDQKSKVPDVKSNQNVYGVGDRPVFTCSNAAEVKNLEWHHVFHTDTTMISPQMLGDEQYTYHLTIEPFDNESYVMCTIPDNKETPDPRYFVSIRVIRDNSPHYSNVLYYNENNKPDFHCNEEKWRTDTSIYMANITANKIKIIDHLNSLTENDSGTIIACFYFSKNYSSLIIERFVKYKTMLKYKKIDLASIPPTWDPNIVVDAQKDDDMSLYYYIGGAAIILIIILLIILLIIMKCRYKNTKLTPQLKEKSIMKSNQVLFAELELYALPNGTFRFGSMSNPKEMLYADLDLASQPQGDRKPVQDDSPYAQIANPATIKAEENNQQGTTGVPTEEAPYAEIVKSDPKV